VFFKGVLKPLGAAVQNTVSEAGSYWIFSAQVAPRTTY
jgi:hypothetical protein